MPNICEVIVCALSDSAEERAGQGGRGLQGGHEYPQQWTIRNPGRNDRMHEGVHSEDGRFFIDLSIFVNFLIFPSTVDFCPRPFSSEEIVERSLSVVNVSRCIEF